MVGVHLLLLVCVFWIMFGVPFLLLRHLVECFLEIREPEVQFVEERVLKVRHGLRVKVPEFV